MCICEEISLKKLMAKPPRSRIFAMRDRVGRCPLPYLTLSEEHFKNLVPGQARESSSLWLVDYPDCTATVTGQRTGCLNASHGSDVATWRKQQPKRHFSVVDEGHLGGQGLQQGVSVWTRWSEKQETSSSKGHHNGGSQGREIIEGTK